MIVMAEIWGDLKSIDCKESGFSNGKSSCLPYFRSFLRSVIPFKKTVQVILESFSGLIDPFGSYQ